MMKKSIYSLVLSDAVVEAADRMAYQRGTSRSALIDELLAEALSCVTPEMRMRDIFISLEEIMKTSQAFRLMGRNSDSLLSIHSALQYKYRPTIRYSIELYRQFQGNAFGELRIQSRTQNGQLLAALEDFYGMWIETEHHFLGHDAATYHLYAGKLVRSLSLPKGKTYCSEEALGEGIGSYIQCFDRGMKLYFEESIDRPVKKEYIHRLIADYFAKEPLIL